MADHGRPVDDVYCQMSAGILESCKTAGPESCCQEEEEEGEEEEVPE